MEVKLAEVDVKTQHNEKKIEELTRELKDFEKETRIELNKINEENKILHTLAVSLENVSKNLSETNNKIDKLSDSQEEMKEKIVNLEHRPAKKALKFNEEIKNKVFISLLIAALGFILGLFLPFTI